MRSFNITFFITFVLTAVSTTSGAPVLPADLANLPVSPAVPAPAIPHPSPTNPIQPRHAGRRDVDAYVKAELEVDGARRRDLGKKRTDVPATSVPATSIPAIIIDATAKIGPISEEIYASIRVGVSVDVIVPLLHKIEGVLQEALVAIRFIAANPQEGVFFYAGRVLPLHEVATLVAALFRTVITLLAAVLAAVATLQSEVIQVITPILILVGSLVGEVVLAVFVISAELQSIIFPLISDLKDTLFHLSLASVAEHLGIAY